MGGYCFTISFINKNGKAAAGRHCTRATPTGLCTWSYLGSGYIHARQAPYALPAAFPAPSSSAAAAAPSAADPAPSSSASSSLAKVCETISGKTRVASHETLTGRASILIFPHEMA